MIQIDKVFGLILTLDEENNVRVLLASEIDEDFLSFPRLDVDDKSTPIKALESYFKNVIPLDVTLSQEFKTIGNVALVIGRLETKPDGFNFNEMLNANNEFIDASIFYDVRMAVFDSESDSDKRLVDVNTGAILRKFMVENYGEQFFDAQEVVEEEPADDSDMDDDLSKAVESLVFREAKPNDEIIRENATKFLQEYEQARKEQPSPMEFAEANGKRITGPTIINVTSANKLILVFKDAKDLKITLEGTVIVDCVLSNKIDEIKPTEPEVKSQEPVKKDEEQP